MPHSAEQKPNRDFLVHIVDLPTIVHLRPAAARRALVVARMSNPADPPPDAEVLPLALRVQHSAVHPGQWRRLGRTIVRWNVFDLYELSVFCAGTGHFPDGDHAIEAEYRRAIAATVLVEATLEEMRRTGCAAQAEAPGTINWLQLALREVARGDRVVAVVSGSSSVCVYHNGIATARCADPDLVRAFAGIWLGPHSRLGPLRSESSR